MADAPPIIAASRTVRVGLIGAGIGESRSPALHEREAASLGFDLRYGLIDLVALGVGPDALPDLLAAAEADGLAGVNVTHPCKQSVIPLLDDLSPDARALGAVNTVVFRAGRRIGHNTDWSGFAESFRRGLPGAALGSVVQLGAGGAGAAVGHAAMVLGARRLAIFDVDGGRADRLAEALARRFPNRRVTAGGDLAATLAVADGLIHATPTGMAAHPGLPLSPALLAPRHWLAEIVYFPLETALLAAARRIGCRTMDGGGMAVFQAVEAFRLFTAREPDAERMLRHFRSMGS
ncbi:MAG: shikimate dehydrogenase [Alphaproteobacteria bacterium]